MYVRPFALIAGIVYALIGILGFVPGVLRPPQAGGPDLAVQAAYGYLFGLFPVNALHSLVHLAVGIWGLVSFTSLTAARTYAQSLTWVFGILAVMGLIPVLNVTFGLLPLFGHDIWLHALTAAVAWYFGYGAGRRAEVLRGERRAA